MINKNKILSISSVISLLLAFTPRSVFAAACDGTEEGSVQTSIIPCEYTKDVPSLLNFGINILSAGIAIAAVGAIVYAGVLYTTAGGNSEQTKKAMNMILNVVIGIIAYAAMYLLLNWIIPGGVI